MPVGCFTWSTCIRTQKGEGLRRSPRKRLRGARAIEGPAFQNCKYAIGPPDNRLA